jgi:hypothetical protein
MFNKLIDTEHVLHAGIVQLLERHAKGFSVTTLYILGVSISKMAKYGWKGMGFLAIIIFSSLYFSENLIVDFCLALVFWTALISIMVRDVFRQLNFWWTNNC